MGKNAMRQCVKYASIGIVTWLAAGAANAAEIKVIASVGVRAVLADLAPAFERSSGHKVTIVYGTAVPLKRQVDSGETFDVVVLVPTMLDDLVKQTKVLAGTSADVAKVGVGVAVKMGEPKPDIGSADTFKKAMLAAKSITYTKESQTSAVLIPVMDRLGIVAEMTPKTILETSSSATAQNVVTGKAELGFILISEILPITDIELAGPLPAELQSYVVFTAGIGSTSKDTAAARAFIDFLKAPAAAPVLKAKGMEPA
jgi:molybdate transport system substrate-binding protein